MSGDTDADEIGYSAAMAELQGILAGLERDDLDIDHLAEQVRRASDLIHLCRRRIARAQDDVDRIVVSLDDAERDGPDDGTSE
jgi:exodeoxyribonuclease VII small subunit